MSVVISAADVKKLRDITGAGMSDCKAALIESDGDTDKAIDFLRLKGQKIAGKREDRDAKEGVCLALCNEDFTKGIIVRISSETDFVSRNEDFVNFCKAIAQTALDTFPATAAELNATAFDGATVGERIMERVAAIGEKIEVAGYGRIEGPCVAPYIHMGNKAAVLMGLNKEGFVGAGRDAAMQVAAMKPISVSKDSVPANVIEKELEIGKELARQEGKPEAMLDKIAQGRLNKFFQESTLLAQVFVKDGKKTVGEYLEGLTPGLTATEFVHLTNG